MVCNEVLIPNKNTPKTGIPPSSGRFTHPHKPASFTTPDIFLKFLLSPLPTPIPPPPPHTHTHTSLPNFQICIFLQELGSPEIKVFVNCKFEWKCFLISFVNFWGKQEAANIVRQLVLLQLYQKYAMVIEAQTAYRIREYHSDVVITKTDQKTVIGVSTLYG